MLNFIIKIPNLGKKTMLEPLQNYGSREQFRKQLVKDYKKSLDEQLANKIRQEKDIVEGNDIKMLEKFVRNDHLDRPIYYPGSIVGDEKIDSTLNKFLEKEQYRDQSFNLENYDDDVFKKRDHEYIQNKLMSKYLAKNAHVQSKSQQRLQLREKGYSSRHVHPANNLNLRYAGKSFGPSRLASRDERLKAPRSSQSQNTKARLKSSALVNKSISGAKYNSATKNTNKLENPYKNSNNAYDHTFETLGSKRKKLLQVSNQTSQGDPFIRARMPSQAAYMNRHLRVSKPY